MYFKDFPRFLYDFNYGNNVTKTSLVRDITRNIRFRRDILANITLYEEYDIIDGETPEIIAEKIYGTPEYHWVVMLANETFDYTSDFPLMEPELQKHIKSSYNPVEYYTGWTIITGTNPRGGNYTISVPQGADESFSLEYATAAVTIYLKGKTTTKSFDYSFDFLDPLQSAYDAVNRRFLQYLPAGQTLTGTPDGQLRVSSEGRENNPVYWINENGFRVNYGTPGAVAVTGAEHHRRENDQKRRIKLISPTLLATVLRNYKELL